MKLAFGPSEGCVDQLFKAEANVKRRAKSKCGARRVGPAGRALCL